MENAFKSSHLPLTFATFFDLLLTLLNSFIPMSLFTNQGLELGAVLK